MTSPPAEGRPLLIRLWGTTFPVYGGGVVLAFLSQLLLTRLLGTEQYGIYYYVLSWLTILVALAKLGVDHALLRYLPGYLANRDWSTACGLLQWGSQTVTRAALAVMACLFLATLAIADTRPELRDTFLIGSLMVPLWATSFLRQAAMRSLYRNARALLPELIVAPLFIMLAVVTAKLASVTPTAIMAMLATVCGFGIALLVGNRWLANALPGELRRATPGTANAAWSASARALFFASSMHLILGNADAVMIGLLVGTDDVGVYGIASRCASLVAFPLTIANTFFAPTIAELLSKREHRELEMFLQQGMRVVVVAALLAATIFWTWGTEILELFGAGFSAGTGFLAILAFGQLVNALCGPVAYMVAFSGREALVAKVLGGSTFFSIGASVLMIPAFGALGAAISTAAGLVCWNVCLYIICCRQLGLSASLVKCIRTP